MFAYLDDDNNVVKTDNLVDYKKGVKYESKFRTIVAQETVNGRFISTVFLAVSMPWGYVDWKNPSYDYHFETMVFNSPDDFTEIVMDRYKTWNEAVAGHNALVERAKNGEFDNE